MVLDCNRFIRSYLLNNLNIFWYNWIGSLLLIRESWWERTKKRRRDRKTNRRKNSPKLKPKNKQKRKTRSKRKNPKKKTNKNYPPLFPKKFNIVQVYLLLSSLYPPILTLQVRQKSQRLQEIPARSCPYKSRQVSSRQLKYWRDRKGGGEERGKTSGKKVEIDKGKVHRHWCETKSKKEICNTNFRFGYFQ